MFTIDAKDRKILYHLDVNSRQPYSFIANKVGLPKNTVFYRIKNLREKGIIKNFWTAINTFILGYNVFRIYLSFQYVSQDVKKKIIERFVTYKYSWAVASAQGEFDLAAVIWVRNIYNFYMFWNATLDEFGDYFAKKTVSIYVQAIAYKKSYLLPEELTLSAEELYRMTCGNRIVDIDAVDYYILNELAIDARNSLAELGRKLDCTPQAVKYRINRLKELGVIQAFRVYIDHKKIGLQKYALDIYLKENSKKSEIVDFLKKCSCLEYLDVAMGWSDIEVEVIVKNEKELYNIIDEINTRFSKAIKKISFLLLVKYHKERWLPEI